MANMTDRPLTTSEAAQRLGVTPQTIINWVHAGKATPLFRLGDRSKSAHAFAVSEVERLARERAS